MAPFYDSITPYLEEQKEVKRMRVRIKFRAFGFEGQEEWGDPLKDKVFMQIAVTIPILMAGIDLEVFI